MTAKQKAIQLVYKYYNEINPDAPDCNISFNQCKQCALIAVDEILNLCWNGNETALNYWNEVKQEIEKL